MSLYTQIEEKLARDEIIILDGGTGTDIQRRGVQMSGETWSAEANLTHPNIVRAVHEDYIEAGADLIIANTFATSPLLFHHLGRDSEIASNRPGGGCACARGIGRPRSGGRFVLHDAARGQGIGPHRPTERVGEAGSA